MTTTQYADRWRFGMRDNSPVECLKTAALLTFMFALLAWTWYDSDKHAADRAAYKAALTETQIAALKLSQCEHGRAMGFLISGHALTPKAMDTIAWQCGTLKYQVQAGQLRALVQNPPIP